MKTRINLILSAALTIALLTVLFKDISFRDILQLISEADRSYLIIFLCFSFLMNICRTWRYKLLLNSVGEAVKIFPLFLAVLIRNCCADLLPAKIGSTAYLWICVTRLGVKMESALSSFFISFVFDLLALVPLLIVLTFAILGSSLSPAAPAIIIILILLLTLPILYWLPLLMQKASLFLSNFKVMKRTVPILEKMREALLKTKSAGIYGRLILISVFIRLGKYFGMYAFLVALLKPLNFKIAANQIAPAFTGLFSAELAASLPISGIAGFGAYESAWTAVFSILGFPSDIALQTGFAHHLATQAYGYGLGLIALAIIMLPFYQTKASSAAVKQRSFLLQSAILSLSFVLLSIPLFASDNPESHKSIKVDSSIETEKFSDNLQNYELYFDSNRSGNFGIYKINFKQKSISTITDTAAHEMYPHVSPNGKLLVFARSWSLARNAPSSLYLIDLENKKEQLISDNGTFPTFSSDNNKIYFERERSKIISYDLLTGNETLIFPLKNFKFEVVKPRINSNQSEVAFISDKQGRWNVWSYNILNKQLTHKAAGCEPFWWGEDIVWIKEKDVQNGSGIYVLKNTAEAVLHENEGLFGHEYFPQISGDSKFLTFSAAPNDQHSHLDANYQIFVKDLASGQVSRITNDSYTNRWSQLTAIK